MDSRGGKNYAVMAMREGWSKPRFVWEGVGTQRMYIYARKRSAARQAKHMNDTRQPGGKAFFVIGWLDKAHNSPKLIEVEWIVLPVWTETMPEANA